MNFNFPNFLNNSMRILNIVHRTLPLIKEVNPAINFVKNKIKNINVNPVQKNTNNDSTELPYENKKIITSNNSLTFFK